MNMKRIFRMLVLATMLTGITLGLAACNTMNGFGRDLESAGRTIQDI